MKKGIKDKILEAKESILKAAWPHIPNVIANKGKGGVLI